MVLLLAISNWHYLEKRSSARKTDIHVVVSLEGNSGDYRCFSVKFDSVGELHEAI